MIPQMCCDTVNRGLAYGDGKIFLQQADTTLVALDAATGRYRWHYQVNPSESWDFTATQPIIFTSRDNVVGFNTANSSGQWGGIVLSGRAPITDCTIAPAATPGTAACERQTEGAVDPALYGGVLNNDNSGRMSYVQIRYSGFVLSGNSELQSLTLGGVGSGTVISHIQSHNSSDDGIEWFGGRINQRYLVLTGNDDDSLDVDTGWRGAVQNLLIVQRSAGGDRSCWWRSGRWRSRSPWSRSCRASGRRR